MPTFFSRKRSDYDRRVRDYTCTFSKTEFLAGELTDEQVMKAMFREKPFSVQGSNGSRTPTGEPHCVRGGQVDGGTATRWRSSSPVRSPVSSCRT